jgi:hypothetical protein
MSSKARKAAAKSSTAGVDTLTVELFDAVPDAMPPQPPRRAPPNGGDGGDDEPLSLPLARFAERS